jgi:uncharacterized protein
MKRHQALAILSQHLSMIQHRFGVKSLAVFGSVARDQARDDSDVDVLVEFEITPGLVCYMDLKFFLEEVLQHSVDIATPNSLKPRIRPHILKEAIVVPRYQVVSG